MTMQAGPRVKSVEPPASLEDTEKSWSKGYKQSRRRYNQKNEHQLGSALIPFILSISVNQIFSVSAGEQSERVVKRFYDKIKNH
jgi:hypothetical protein